MTLDTTELRRLRGEYHSVLEAHESGLIRATPEFLRRVETTYGTALDNAAPALLDAADRLARIEAVMGGVEAVERVALALVNKELWIECRAPISKFEVGTGGNYRQLATAALAALRELIGADA